MSERFQHKVVEVPASLFGGKLSRRLQEALDKLGAQGWELVAVTQASSLDAVRLFLKKGL